MTLDLDQVGQQLATLEKWFLDTDAGRSARISKAQDLLREHSDKWKDLAAIAESPLPPLFSSIAVPQGPLSQSVTASLSHRDFTIVAVDGSQIDIDRDNPFACYLINIGKVVLTYGSGSDAVLDSRAILGYQPQDLFVTNPKNADRREPVEGALLNAKRSVEETKHLVELVRELDKDCTCIALIDNSLVLWGLAGSRFDDFVKEQLLTDYRGCLDDLYTLSQGRKMAVAGYISRPGSASVVSLLRLALCNRNQNCQQCNRELQPGERACDQIADVLDRQLFADILQNTGEASSVFRSSSRVVNEHYAEHPVFFFYFNAGSEIARVEIPEWVANDPDRLELLQSLLHHQVESGLGYPVSLTEAHEQAVVSFADREQFWNMVEDTLGIHPAFSVMSGKTQSKRLRAL